MVSAGTDYEAARAKAILKNVYAHPELRDGLTGPEQVEANAAIISRLLEDLFPPVLTLNEIKAVSLPYLNIIFNHSERFRNILADAGPDFDITIRDFDEHQFYVASCCLILNRFYGTHLDFTKPLFYDIPAADGVIRHYRILYNADFLELIPTEAAPVLSQKQIDKLLNNYDDLELWKKTFPASAWMLKGFALMTLVDVTVENAVSNLKSTLLVNNNPPDLQQALSPIFQSIFKITDIQMGFTPFDKEEGVFTSKLMGQKAKSHLLANRPEVDSNVLFCDKPYTKLMKAQSYFAIADMEDFAAKHPDSDLGQHFLDLGIHSVILAPVVKNDVLLGILELVSPIKKQFNSVNAHKLEVVMPFIVDSIDRKMSEIKNKIQAVIQNNYTTLHPSVDWKFQREAQNYIQKTNGGLTYSLKEIVFKNVYPLYGQVDIKDSSVTRNRSVINDLSAQLNQLIYILNQVNKHASVALIEQHLIDLKGFLIDLAENIKADTEQSIQHYLETWVYPLLRNTDNFSDKLRGEIKNYFDQIDRTTGEFHLNRRSYEKTLGLINEKLADIMDARQDEIQHYFPHYFERFRTDGIEHNMYIGATIAPKLEFKPDDLHRLRLWQLMVTAEMAIEHEHLKEILPFPLDVTSLLLVFSTPIDIRFRMDEKHFDIDGAYNVRYEVIKKRIDKSRILGSDERITQPGKITIVYSKAEEETEYRNYISILQKHNIIDTEIEHFEVEDLQSVSGLKALRIAVKHDTLQRIHKFNYNTLYL